MSTKKKNDNIMVLDDVEMNEFHEWLIQEDEKLDSILFDGLENIKKEKK